MVVDAGDEPYVEDAWFGRELPDRRRRGPGSAPPSVCCGLDPTGPPSTGDKDGSLLKAPPGYRPSHGGEPWFGVDAHVVVPGDVRLGDLLTLRGGGART